jgi:hypothetical protein
MDIMEISYISGPISADTAEAVEANVHVAAAVAAKLVELGYAVICPHTNSFLVNQLVTKDIAWEFWIRSDLEMLKHCDLLITVPGWQLSKGACIEVRTARALNIPIYHFPHQMPPQYASSPSTIDIYAEMGEIVEN